MYQSIPRALYSVPEIPTYRLLQAAARARLPNAAARIVLELYGRAMNGWQPLDYREVADALGDITADTARRAITVLIETRLVEVRHLGHGRKEARLRHPGEE